MKKKEEIIKELLIQVNGVDISRTQLIELGFQAGFESFRVKVEEGVKKEFDSKKCIISEPSLWDGDTVIGRSDSEGINAPLSAILTTIREIKQ